MAKEKLSQQNAISTADTDSYIYVIQDGNPYKIKKSDFQKELSSGYLGKLAIADTPTADGYYMATETGTYTNAGSLVTDLSLGVNYINVSSTQTVFGLSIITQSIAVIGVIAADNEDAVDGDTVYTELKTNYDNLITSDYTIQSVSLSNGATASTNGFTIPVGQTGDNSYIVISPVWSDQVYTDLDTLEIQIQAKIKCTDYPTSLIDNWAIGTNGAMNEISEAYSFNSTTNILTCTINTTCDKDYIYDTDRWYVWINTNGVMTTEAVFELVGVLVEIVDYTDYIKQNTESKYKVSKQIETESQALIDTSIDNLLRYNKIDYSQNPANLFNGATASYNGWTVPIGSSGGNTYVIIYPDWTDSVYTDLDGLEMQFIIKSKITNYSEFTGASFDWVIGKSGGVTKVSQDYSWDATTEILTASINFTCDKDYIVGTDGIYIEKDGSEVVSAEVVFEILDVYFDVVDVTDAIQADGFENYKTQKQIQRELTITPTIFTAEATGTSTAAEELAGTFRGVVSNVNAIQRAINAIPDNSDSPYEIRCFGEFTTTAFADMSAVDDYGRGYKAFLSFTNKKNIKIVGMGNRKTILSCILPNTGVGDFDKYQVITMDCVDCELENLQIIGQNLRYPVHTDTTSGVDNFNENSTLIFTNCHFWHKGNTGDALTQWTSFSSYGVGISEGMKIITNNCRFTSKDYAGFNGHDGYSTENSTIEVNNCFFDTWESPSNYAMTWNLFGDNDSKFRFILNGNNFGNCKSLNFSKNGNNDEFYANISGSGNTKTAFITAHTDEPYPELSDVLINVVNTTGSTITQYSLVDADGTLTTGELDLVCIDTPLTTEMFRGVKNTLIPLSDIVVKAGETIVSGDYVDADTGELTYSATATNAKIITHNSIDYLEL